METLNKNWFAITLVAVVFGTLGFLLGSQATHNSCPMMGNHQGMVRMMGSPLKMGENHMMFIPDGKDMIEDIDIQREDGEDGEKKIKVTVKGKKD